MTLFHPEDIKRGVGMAIVDCEWAYGVRWDIF